MCVACGRSGKGANMLTLFDRYFLKQFALMSVLILATLSLILLMAQSLKFLELVIESGASVVAFFRLSSLAMPRLIEVLTPFSMVSALLFLSHRLTQDRELVVIRATGFSPLRISRAPLLFSAFLAVMLFCVTGWISPLALGHLKSQRNFLKSHYSTLLFREGLFNQVSKGLMVYVNERHGDSTLQGLILQDSRDQKMPPQTILARKGIVQSSAKGQQIIVYEGSRQSVDPKTRYVSRLSFDRYTIDIPEDSALMEKKWREPEERTLPELFHPNPESEKDQAHLSQFRAEIHKRFLNPLLAPVFALFSLCFVMVGSIPRQGISRRFGASIATIIGIQALYLLSYKYAQEQVLGIIAMHVIVWGGLCGGFLFLSAVFEEKSSPNSLLDSPLDSSLDSGQERSL